MASSEVGFDIQAMVQCANQYKQLCSDLNGIRKDLNDALTTLTGEYWVGTASAKFESKIGASWLDGVSRYSDLLSQLGTAISEIAKMYDQLLQEAKALQFTM